MELHHACRFTDRSRFSGDTSATKGQGIADKNKVSKFSAWEAS